MMNSDRKVDVENTTSIRWDCSVLEDESDRYIQDGSNFYINRRNQSIYSMLIQRPLVVKHALENYSKMVAYVDSDSISTKYVDSIFDYYDSMSKYPFFVEGIYDYFMMGGRGGVVGDDFSTSLEHPACVLFGVDQSIRQRYRQTGYFVSDESCVMFLEEWYHMCSHPEVVQNCALYAPYNEETILNVLLWKKKILNGLPYIYVNGGYPSIDEVYGIGFAGENRSIREWLKIPAKEELLLFFHGEKNPENMALMIEKIKKY
jgi:hypothetical protein